MKKIVYSIFILWLVMIVGCNHSNVLPTRTKLPDEDSSLVHSEWEFNTKDHKVRDYFIVENGDTSAYYFQLINYTYSHEYIMNLCMRRFKESEPDRYRIKDAQGIIEEMDSCLARISKDYQIDSLKFLGFPLSYMGNISVEFNQKLIPKKSYRHYQLHPTELKSACENTSLDSLISLSLSKYNLKVSEKTVHWGLPLSKDEFLMLNKVSDSSLVQEEMTVAKVNYRIAKY